MDHLRPPPRHHAGRGGLHASIPGGGGSDTDLREKEPKSKGLKGGVEKMKRYLANLSFVEMSVVKATSATDGPPKRKHTSRLVEESWRDPQIAPVEAMNALGRCPMLNSPLISLKVLATAHELMQKGSPAVLPASYEWRDHFVMLDKHWTAAVADVGATRAAYGLGRLCAGLVVAYARALLKKTKFHDACPGFENNYSFPGATSDSADANKCASLKSLEQMLQLGKTLREALDVCTGALPRNPPLAALQWHRLVSHVGVLIAVEAHLLHGASVYVAAKTASLTAGGIPGAIAREIVVEHDALRSAFSEARSRPAIKTAFMEEGGADDGSRRQNENGVSFSFLELPDKLPDFLSDGGREAMASAMASSFGPPSSHQRPSLVHVENELTSPFDEYNSDDELAAATERDMAEKPAQPTIDLPPLIDFEAEEDVNWDVATRASQAAPPPPRPPLFGGYGGVQTQKAQPSVSHFPQSTTSAASSGSTPTFTSASSSAFAMTSLSVSGYGSPSMAASKSATKMIQHARSPSVTRETFGTLDIDASLAAFELTAPRAAENKNTKVDGAAPLMFADLAPAGVSSVRVAPAPRSMIAQRGSGGAGAASGVNIGFPSFHQAYGHMAQPHNHAPMQQQPMMRTASGGLLQYPGEQPGGFHQQPQQPQQQYQQHNPALARPGNLGHTVYDTRQTPSPPPPGSPPPQDWAKFDDSAVERRPVRNAPAPVIAQQPQPLPASIARQLIPIEPMGTTVTGPSGANAIIAMPVQQEGEKGVRQLEYAAPVQAPAFDEIPIGAIAFGKRVGTGAFGEVLKATYQGTDVAVKRLRLDPSQPQAAEDFRRELRVLCGLRHRHVVQFLGACTTGPDLCLVMDFCGFGSLYGVLHNRRQNITAAHVLRWMADTCRGMMYLHSRRIIHRDIKSGNLLLDDSGVIKVADFGLARAHGPTSNLLTLVGTYPYMAPELLDSQPYNSSVDVYSFGVVMWECLTRDEPFRGCSPMQIVATLMRGERPKLPEKPALPTSYVKLLTECWATQPERRPSFGQALERLLGITAAMRAAEGER